MSAETTRQRRLAYSVSEAASLLGFTTSALHQKVWRGEVPSQRVGRSVRIPASYVERFADPDYDSDPPLTRRGVTLSADHSRPAQNEQNPGAPGEMRNSR